MGVDSRESVMKVLRRHFADHPGPSAKKNGGQVPPIKTADESRAFPSSLRRGLRGGRAKLNLLSLAVLPSEE